MSVLCFSYDTRFDSIVTIKVPRCSLYGVFHIFFLLGALMYHLTSYNFQNLFIGVR